MAPPGLWNTLGSVALAASLLVLPSPVVALPELRILPLGDSITKGSGSSSINGYRGPLREMLVAQAKRDGGAAVIDMIGTLRHGSMTDNDHEGHSGEYLADIAKYWQAPARVRPNVALIHAGTNNMDKEVDLDTAIDLMTGIIDGLLKAVPEITILVAPVIWANNPRMQANTDKFNPQIEALVNARKAQGKHVALVPMDIGVGDLSDLKHPNDKGYKKMADYWYDAIMSATAAKWIDDAVKVAVPNAPALGLGVCGGNSGSGGMPSGRIWEKKGKIFDGPRTWESIGTIGDATTGVQKREQVFLVDLNGDGIADYVAVHDNGDIYAWINGGKLANDWTSLGKVNPDWSSIKGENIRLADVDNDGKADLIALYSDGAAKVWRNADNGKAFKSLDSKWATGISGVGRDNVVFEDIDGDGFADYVIVYDGGAVKWARNTHNNGKDSKKKNWETEVSIAPGPAGIPSKSTRMKDLDGDKKADYLVVYAGGAVKAFRNTLGDGGGRTWEDLGTIAPGVGGVTGEMIRFADMDGDGLADFIALADDGSIRMWKNLGLSSGTDKGSSIRLADLTGDGKADIISVDAKGRARAWINQGVDKWQSIGEIAPGFSTQDLGDGRIEFADINGDNRTDYLVIYGGGAVKAYLNNGNLPAKAEGVRIWQEAITISPGVGEPGSKVRFADLNGDGYDDFLILYDGGAVKCWLNNQNVPPKDGKRIWAEGSTVATGVGEPGNKIRFADLTGDGKAEYIVQYDGGAAKAYRNNGNIPSGTGRKWSEIGTIAAGVSPQGPVRYADIDGDGKDDYLVVFEDGSINAYINSADWEENVGNGDNPIGTQPPGDNDNGDDDQPPGDNDNGDDGDDGGESAPPYIPDPEDDKPLALCKYTPTTMDEIEALDYNNELPPHCVPGYMALVLAQMLEDSLKRFQEIMDGGYDKYYKIFANHVVRNAGTNLFRWMLENGNDHFTCEIWAKFSCCENCKNLDLRCDTCIDSSDTGGACKRSSPWDVNPGQEWRIRKMPCPPDMSKRGTNSEEDQRRESIWWTLWSKEDEFYDTVRDDVGIPKDRIVWSKHALIPTGPGEETVATCAGYMASTKYDDLNETCQRQFWWHDSPSPSDDFAVDDVFNPKSIIGDTLKDLNLATPMAEIALAILAGQYNDEATGHDENDYVDALVLPVSMIYAAVEQMEEVVKLAKEIKEAEEQAFILQLLSAIFLFVGGTGAALANAGFKFLGRALVAGAEAGNTGLGIHTVVFEPASAPLAIFGLVMSYANIRDAVKMSRAANIRRDMPYKDVSDMSPLSAHMVQLVSKTNRRPKDALVCGAL